MRISNLAALLCIAAFCGHASWAQAADAKDVAKDVKVTKTRKPPSVCVGLSESACAGKSECYWRKATTTKAGKPRRAHCRIKRSAVKSAPT